jgi:predicted neuraminidase
MAGQESVNSNFMIKKECCTRSNRLYDPIRCIGYYLLLVHLLGINVNGQPASQVMKMAYVVPIGSFKVEKASKGGKVFSDRPFIMQELPAVLSRSSFVQGSMEEGVRFKAATSGVLYVVTPLKGQPNSTEEALVQQGFTKLDQPSFKLFKGQTQEIGIFSLNIANKFVPFHFAGWAIPFFSSQLLSSITVPAKIIWSPGKEYSLGNRKWQGCPTIELTGERLWNAWFSGGVKEPDRGNYGVVTYSDDKGVSWVDPAMIIVHPDSNVRVMDPQIWKDPKGRLWIFWVQNTGANGFDGLWGTWAIRIDNPESKSPTWTQPRRLTDGLTRNKVTVLSTGEWLLPSYNWINNQSAVYSSDNQGETWKMKGGPINDQIYFYEHMTVELNDGRLWMLQRRMKESYSSNKGKDWTELTDNSNFTSADSRLFIRRLNSGNLLLVYNHDPEKKSRKNLTAFLSDDDGKTWRYKLPLDERVNTSYPDAIQDKDGLIYLTYDHSRTGEKEILITMFTEKDVMAGSYQSKNSQQKKVISKAP